MIPSVGRIVLYRLATHDLPTINERVSGRVGNSHREGDIVPMLVCRVWADASNEVRLPGPSTPVNGQVFIDGNFSLWVMSRVQGDEPGQWSDPRGV